MKTLNRVFSNYIAHLWEKLIYSLQYRTVLTFLFIAAIIIVIPTITFQIAEHDNQNSLWRTVVYAMSGIDVDPPQTSLGRIMATVVVLSGVLFISLITGFIASEFSRAVVSSKSVRPKPVFPPFEDHIVIFGWGPKRQEILRQLSSEWASRGYQADDIVIVSPHEFIERGDDDIYKNVWHVRGEPTDINVLRYADLTPHRGRGAKVAVILGDFSETRENNDQESLLQVLAVEHLHPDIISLAEVQLEENVSHFKNANVDEIFVSENYASLILARTAEFRGLASYFDEVLALAPIDKQQGYSTENQPVSIYVRTAKQLGITGQNFSEAVLEYQKRKGGLIMGMFSAAGPQFIPELGERYYQKLHGNEQLILMARPSEA